MTNPLLTAVRCAGAAGVLALLADALLRVGPWGINATLWLVACAACLFTFAPAGRKRLPALILLFALFFMWRDAPVLRALNGLAVASICLTVALPLGIQRLSRSAMVHYLV